MTRRSWSQSMISGVLPKIIRMTIALHFMIVFFCVEKVLFNVPNVRNNGYVCGFAIFTYCFPDLTTA